ncbi:PE-PPE domain-containing protein [Mycolicibacterium phlei]|jgi:hypothetical protein
MRQAVRSVLAAGVALAGVVALAMAWTAATAVQLAATALIMGGADHPLGPPHDQPGFVNPYLNNAVNGFINPAAGLPSGTGGAPIEAADGDVYAVVYPAEFFPVFGRKTFGTTVRIGRENLNNCARGTGVCDYNDEPAVDFGPPVAPPVPGEDLVIFGYSESAVVASLVKRDLIENPRDGDGVSSMFLLANPMRPNGGILVLGPRGFTIPILDIPFYGPTPTNSCDVGDCIATVDAASQYDLLGGDAPSSLTNLLALINSLAAYVLMHGDMQNANFDNALYQGSYGDTDYYLFPAERLPILMPFERFVPSPILTALDAPLRAAIEGAYHRDINPGVPVGLTLTSLLPFHDPLRTVVNILRAIPVGLDDAIAEFTGDPDFRPFGTKPVTSPYGVGGPELPAPPEEDELPEEGFAAERATTAEDGEESSGDGISDDEAGEGEAREDDVTEDLGAIQELEEPKLPRVRGPIRFDSVRESAEGDATEEDEAADDEAPTTPAPDDSKADDADDSEDSEDDGPGAGEAGEKAA